MNALPALTLSSFLESLCSTFVRERQTPTRRKARHCALPPLNHRTINTTFGTELS